MGLVAGASPPIRKEEEIGAKTDLMLILGFVETYYCKYRSFVIFANVLRESFGSFSSPLDSSVARSRIKPS